MVIVVPVNAIELPCSAGLPAIYTQVLALSDLLPATHNLYLLVHVLVFMADHFAIFAAAMITLRFATVAGRYTRFAHLLGAVILLAIGLMMLFAPQWLA